MTERTHIEIMNKCVGTKFGNQHFKEGEFIRLKDVKVKLLNMGPHRDILKMAVIFFLKSVVCVQMKIRKDAEKCIGFVLESHG